MNNLEKFKVIDRLEVGPVQMEANRLRTTYRLIRDGKADSTTLTYKYEENVFSVDDPDSQNLAAMIAVQVAFNYGLFCNELVFHDCFDRCDKRFIKDMVENTAREIYVNKLIHHNSFLEKEYLNLTVSKLDYYCQADIIFTSEAKYKYNSKKRDKKLWDVDNSTYSVLSSGGKDSLLSFGLLNEIGHEVHPVKQPV